MPLIERCARGRPTPMLRMRSTERPAVGTPLFSGEEPHGIQRALLSAARGAGDRPTARGRTAVKGRARLRWAFLALVALAAALAIPVANASQIISTSTVTDLTLGVNDKGEAMVSYVSNGRTVHVLAWGAVNAIAPVATGRQVALSLLYDGGYEKYYVQNPAAQTDMAALRGLQSRMTHWTAAKNNPKRYALAPRSQRPTRSSTRCATRRTTTGRRSPARPTPGRRSRGRSPPARRRTAATGRYRSGSGSSPTTASPRRRRRLRWKSTSRTGPVRSPCSPCRRTGPTRSSTTSSARSPTTGAGVYGFSSTPGGEPLDSFGRNLYVDTFDSAYGPGWQRENSFLTHSSSGSFCYGFYPHGSHPSGQGTEYRATIMGPGLMPDMMWQGTAPGPYDPTAETAANQAIAALRRPSLRPGLSLPAPAPRSTRSSRAAARRGERSSTQVARPEPQRSRGIRARSKRRERDLNPRRTFQHVRDFQSRSLGNRSATSPVCSK